ncbi:hypothetical protein [Streptomyces avermitilis]|uniref:hypothetical protein n=1 Tax=Streptomyces avermitilis TaxID=33903 RepID=UPI0038062D9F
MTYRTVKQFADAATPEELFTGQWQNRPSVLNEYKPYLDDRGSEGYTNAWKLWEEIVPLGYKSSYQRVRAYLHDKRTSPRPVTARPRPGPSPDGSSAVRTPSPTQSNSNSRPSGRNAPNSTPSPGTSAPSRPCSPGRAPDRLVDAVRQDDLPSLHTLAAGIDRDRDAVIAGLTLPWSSGAVEGHVNRIKMLKRQMFGRAAGCYASGYYFPEPAGRVPATSAAGSRAVEPML